MARNRNGKDWSQELERLNFRCKLCTYAWEGAPDLVEPEPEQPHHPFRYFAECPACGSSNQPQAAWERALLKAHQHATGPKTPEGIAATAANLVGHPTPEEALRTRFNAMKHGMNARTAVYFPAKPDRYDFCARCDVDRAWCADQPACVKQTELFMLHHAAFEQRDPRVLGRIHGDIHAALIASLQMCLQSVLSDGVVLKVPKVQLDDKGRCVTLTFEDAQGNRHNVMEYMANPVFKPISDLITRLGLSLSDLGMTIKSAEDEDAGLRGRLGGNVAAPEALEAFSQRMSATLEKLPALFQAAAGAAAKDPVLLEHQAQTGTGT